MLWSIGTPQGPKGIPGRIAHTDTDFGFRLRYLWKLRILRVVMRCVWRFVFPSVPSKFPSRAEGDLRKLGTERVGNQFGHLYEFPLGRESAEGSKQ